LPGGQQLPVEHTGQPGEHQGHGGRQSQTGSERDEIAPQLPQVQHERS
jgi:hypothetical protein